MSAETVSIIVELPASIHRLIMPSAQKLGWDDLVATALLRYYLVSQKQTEEDEVDG